MSTNKNRRSGKGRAKTSRQPRAVQKGRLPRKRRDHQENDVNQMLVDPRTHVPAIRLAPDYPRENRDDPEAELVACVRFLLDTYVQDGRVVHGPAPQEGSECATIWHRLGSACAKLPLRTPRDPDDLRAGPLEWCRIQVDEEGQSFDATYKWSGLDVPGHTRHTEDMSEWSTKDILQVACDLIGIRFPRDRAKVEIQR